MDDRPWFKVLDRFGLPTLLVLMLFAALERRDNEARRVQSQDRERLAAVVDRLGSAVDNLATSTRDQSAEVRGLAERVSRLENLGARVMEARGRTR